MEIAAFLALALRCGPAVAPDTLLAVARHESRLVPWTLHDNRTGESRSFATREAAEEDGQHRIARGHSVDFGLMQVNSGNFGWLGVTANSVLEPCLNVQAGAEVLRRAYAMAVERIGEGPETLRMALSLYNTGDPRAGIVGGYVAAVERVAPAYQVPPLSNRDGPDPATPPVRRARQTERGGPAPADVNEADPFEAAGSGDPFAGGRARHDGSVW
jgi:type IV secretion system protein VirB1